jgi:hypothetical protein
MFTLLALRSEGSFEGLRPFWAWCPTLLLL